MRTATHDNDLSHALRVDIAGCIHRRETFVIVIMTNEDQFNTALQKHAELRRTRDRYSEVADAWMQDATRIED